jgi:hypothetical protein
MITVADKWNFALPKKRNRRPVCQKRPDLLGKIRDGEKTLPALRCDNLCFLFLPGASHDWGFAVTAVVFS